MKGVVPDNPDSLTFVDTLSYLSRYAGYQISVMCLVLYRQIIHVHFS